MNAARQKWIEFLRSGDYEQTTARLRTFDDRYCCLGVACEAYRQEHKGHWKRDRPGSFVFDAAIFSAGRTTSGYIINTPIAAWLELDRDEEQEYVSMNERGQSFSEIADAIEART